MDHLLKQQQIKKMELTMNKLYKTTIIIIISIFFSSCDSKPDEIILSSYDNGNPQEKLYILKGDTLEKQFFYDDGKIKKKYLYEDNNITKVFLYYKKGNYSVTHVENGKYVGNSILYYRDGRIMEKSGFLHCDMNNDTFPAFTTFYSYDTINGQIILKKLDAFRKKKLKKSQGGWLYNRMATLFFNGNGSIDSLNSYWAQIIGQDTITNDEDYKFSVRIYEPYSTARKDFHEVVIGQFNENVVPLKVIPGKLTDYPFSDTIDWNSGYKNKFYFKIKKPFKKGYNYFHVLVQSVSKDSITNSIYIGEYYFIHDFYVVNNHGSKN